MDIIDIEKVLNEDDDSFIFLEDKTQDVANILQQWKSNNPLCNNNQDQGYKLNTKTYTRPKRKSALNLDTQFFSKDANNGGGINPQIGGMVTNMQKSFLQDTSPPPSICSSISMDYSVDRMNNSLITSADFSNDSFFQTNQTENLDFYRGLTPSTEAIADYTLTDLLRDRKVLDDLTMSGDSTIIKDSQIAQIDEMSLMSSSTINNSSTDSLSGSADVPQSGTTITLPKDATFGAKTAGDDFISNTTFELVNTTQTVSNNTYVEKRFDATIDVLKDNNEPINGTFKKSNLNETYEAPASGGLVGMKQFIQDELNYSQGTCTPDNSFIRNSSFNIEQSTPLHGPGVSSTKKYTPSIKGIVDEVNISPITTSNLAGPKIINGTYDKIPINVNNKTFEDNDVVNKFDNIGEANVEDILNASCTYNEEDFDNLLDKFGKYTPTDDVVKTRNYVDSIKKKYATPPNNSTSSSKLQQQIESLSSSNDSPTLTNLRESSEINSSNSMTASTTVCAKLTNSTNGLSTSCNRLLKLRERLYDDIPTNISNKSLSQKESLTTTSEKDENTATAATQEEEEMIEFEKTEKENNRKSNKIRDRERFKTMRIFKRPDETADLKVPRIDGDTELPENTENEFIDDEEEAKQRFSRIDSHMNAEKFAPTNNNTIKMDSNNYATYKKPKDTTKSSSVGPSPPANTATSAVRSLSRPKYISGLQKFGFASKESISKAASADDLEKSDEPISTDSPGSKFSFKKLGGPGKIGGAQTASSDLKSPMGTKAKSLHNLSNNFGFSATKKGSGLKAPNAAISRPATGILQADNRRPAENGFKVPTTATKNRLVRPSSGYYGSSSKSSISSDSQSSLNEPLSQRIPTGPPHYHKSAVVNENAKIEPKATTGIPKPSGLRPPSAIKKSGLPRPASIVRR